MGKKELERKLKWYNNQIIGEYDIGKEASNYLDIIAQSFNLAEHEKDELMQKAKLVWPDRQWLFGTNTCYENILLGIALKLLEKYRSDHISNYAGNYRQHISNFIKDMNEDNFKKNQISVYNVYQIVTDLGLINTVESESLEHTLTQLFSFDQSQNERLSLILEEVFSKYKTQFNQMHPINSFIGALLYVHKESNQHVDSNETTIDIADLVGTLHEDESDKHLNDVYKTYQLFQEFYSIQQEN